MPTQLGGGIKPAPVGVSGSAVFQAGQPAVWFVVPQEQFDALEAYRQSQVIQGITLTLAKAVASGDVQISLSSPLPDALTVGSQVTIAGELLDVTAINGQVADVNRAVAGIAGSYEIGTPVFILTYATFAALALAKLNEGLGDIVTQQGTPTLQAAIDARAAAEAQYQSDVASFVSGTVVAQ